jgi:hypothetical protein
MKARWGPRKQAERSWRETMSSELAYLGMLSATLFLYIMLAFLSLSPSGVVGKMCTIHFSVQNNQFLRKLLESLGFYAASPMKLRILLYLIILLTWLCYLWAILIFSRRRDKGLFPILSFTAVLSLLLLFTPPLLSRDLFSYIYYGRIAVVYQNNPYLVTPQKFLTDPLFSFTSLFWKNTPAVYGPFFTLLSMLLTWPTGENITLSIYLFKFVLILCNLACVLLIWHLLGRYAPRRRRLGTMLYAWNPLVLIHTAGGGHNDIVMAMLALAALALVMKGRKYSGFAFLCLSFLVKYVTVIFMLSYAIYLYMNRASTREWIRDMLAFALIFLVLFFAFYLPFWSGMSTFSPLFNNLKLRNVTLPAGWLVAGVIWFLRAALRLPSGAASTVGNALCSLVLTGGFLVFLVHRSLRCRRVSDMPDTWFLLALAFLLTRPYYLSWYLLWVFPFLCLRKWDRLAQGVLLVGTLTLVFADVIPYAAGG